MLVSFAVIFAVIVRGMSRTALTVTACSAGLVACLALLTGGGNLPSASADKLAEKVSRSGKAEEIYNLTGRTDIWAYAVEAIGEAPVMGWGYAASRQVIARPQYAVYSKFETVHAHNLWLNVAMCGGFVALVLMALMFLNLARNAIVWPNAVPDMILAFVLLAGITEPVLFGPMPRSHMAIWILALCWRPLRASLADSSQPRPAHEV
jgi:O-antigen ligase